MKDLGVFVLLLVCLLVIHAAQAQNGCGFKYIQIEVSLKSNCAACVGRIRKSIKNIEGVQSVSVSTKKPITASVSYQSEKVSKGKILGVLRKDKNILMAKELKESRMFGKFKGLTPPQNNRIPFSVGDYITPLEIEDYKIRERLKKRMNGLGQRDSINKDE